MAQEELDQQPEHEPEATQDEEVQDQDVEVVDDDGHTLEDITPMEIDEDDDDETAVNNEDDPDEYKNWERDELGPMADYAVEDEAEEPQCLSKQDDDFEPGV